MLGAIAGGLLGAGAGFLGGQKGKEAQYDPYGTLNPEQRSMVQAMGPQLQSAATAGPQLYGGQLTAEMSPEESGYYNPTRAGLMTGTIDTMLQEANDPVAFNNAFNRGMVDPTYQNFNQNILPGILEGYSGFSTAAGNARVQALNTVGNDLMMKRYEGQQAAKDRALNAYGKVADVQNYLAAPRIFQQAGLDRKYQDYVGADARAKENIDKALQFLGISTSTYTPAQQDTRWSGMLGGALQGGMLGAMGGSLLGGGTRAVNAVPTASSYSGLGGLYQNAFPTTQSMSYAPGYGSYTPTGVSRTAFMNGNPYSI
jgi:hypothetical protein